MTEGRFTEADLEPSEDERRAARAALADAGAAALGALASGGLAGALLAISAAASVVLERTPSTFAAHAMSLASARVDALALGAALLALGCEIVRTWIGRRRARRLLPRLRRLSAVLLAALAAFVALSLTPSVAAMHASGAERAAVAGAQEKSRLLHRTEIALGAALALLHVATLFRPPRAGWDDEDEDDAPAPLPPGG